MRIPFGNKLWTSVKDEQGAGTFFAMSFAFICIAVGGLAVDASNVFSVKQRLQSSTDIAAHAAALQLANPDTFPGQSTAEVAIDMLLVNMPQQKFGVALAASDVVVGYWNPATARVVATLPAGVELDRAVSVTSRLDGEVGNVVPTFLLKIIGFDFWEVSTTSVFARGTPDCFNGGFIAGGEVDIASNDEFHNGFCIHGNQGVDVNSHIVFGSGVHVSMPNSDLTRNGGMFALRGTNHTWVDGMDNQLGNAWLEPTLASVASINSMIAALSDPLDADLPDYITDGNVNSITVRANAPLQIGDLDPNAINIIDCPQRGLNFPDNQNISNVVVIADCKINFGQGAIVTNSIIATTDTGNQSINAPSFLQLGQDDSCTDGGGVTLITLGDAHFSAQTSWYGAEVIANGDVHVSANANGIEGISIQAAGDITATSNLGMGLCNSGVDHYIDQYQVRMVN